MLSTFDIMFSKTSEFPMSIKEKKTINLRVIFLLTQVTFGYVPNNKVQIIYNTLHDYRYIKGLI